MAKTQEGVEPWVIRHQQSIQKIEELQHKELPPQPKQQQASNHPPEHNLLEPQQNNLPRRSLDTLPNS
jgi:hypothetical protein